MDLEPWMVESFLQALHNIAKGIGGCVVALGFIALTNAFRK